MKYLFAAFVLTAAGLSAAVAQTENKADWEAPAHWTQAQRDRYHDLLGELRCLVCQNESLASSSASLAGDLRTQVQDMINRGAGNREIKAYLVERYGDFVLYDPPVKPHTWLLWGGPFLILVLGAAIAWRVMRTSRAGGAESDLSEAEHVRAKRYLEEEDRK